MHYTIYRVLSIEFLNHNLYKKNRMLQYFGALFIGVKISCIVGFRHILFTDSPFASSSCSVPSHSAILHSILPFALLQLAVLLPAQNRNNCSSSSNVCVICVSTYYCKYHLIVTDVLTNLYFQCISFIYSLPSPTGFSAADIWCCLVALQCILVVILVTI